MLGGIDLLALRDLLTTRSNAEGQPVVLDPVRRKYVRATPEEIVRQLWILYFVKIRTIHPKLIAAERVLKINGLRKRFDLVIFRRNTTPLLLAEFKSPDIPLGQAVFDQVVNYNMQLNVPYALVSNGLVHYAFSVDADVKRFVFLDALPDMQLLIDQ